MDQPVNHEIDKKVSTALKDLTSKNSQKRIAAEQLLESLGPSGFELILELMGSEASTRKKQRKCTAYGIGIYIGILALVVCVSLLRHKGFPTDIFTSASGMTGIFGGLAYVSQAQKNGAKWISQFDTDKRAAGPLIDSLAWQDQGLRTKAELALTSLLPLMTDDELKQLSKSQRNNLHHCLTSTKEKFIKCALRALGVAGDLTTRPNVQKLANGELACGFYPSVQRSAVETLAAIDTRIARQTEAMTLLHPSTAPTANPDVLLRPHHGPSNEDSFHLLRASNSPQVN